MTFYDMHIEEFSPLQFIMRGDHYLEMKNMHVKDIISTQEIIKTRGCDGTN